MDIERKLVNDGSNVQLFERMKYKYDRFDIVRKSDGIKLYGETSYRLAYSLFKKLEKDLNFRK